MALHEQSVGATDEWFTPPYIFEAMGVRFDVDAASPGQAITPWIPADEFITARSLEVPWRGFAWLNAPFGGRMGLVPWLAKFEAHGGGVCLVPDRTSAPWWQRFVTRAELVLFISKKIRFIGADGKEGKSPAQGTCLYSFGPRGRAALENAARRGLGTLMIPVNQHAPLTASGLAIENGGTQAEEATVMVDNKVTQLKSVPSDAVDFESLWVDPKLGDGITTTSWNSVPIGKPKAFFRAYEHVEYIRRTEIYVHKVEGVIGEQYFIVAPSMRGRIEEARPCTLVCCVYRDGSPRIWPIMFPREGESDNRAWIDARAAVKLSFKNWIRIVWVGGAYQIKCADPAYAPDPDWTKLPPWEDLVRQAVGEHGVIRDESHAIYREVIVGAAAKTVQNEPLLNAKDF